MHTLHISTMTSFMTRFTVLLSDDKYMLQYCKGHNGYIYFACSNVYFIGLNVMFGN